MRDLGCGVSRPLSRTSDVWIIRPGALGDTLMLAPALANLQQDVRISLLGRYPALTFVKDLVFRAVDLESGGWHRLFMADIGRKGPFIQGADLVVAFFRDPWSWIERNLRACFPSACVQIFPSLPPRDTRMHVALYICKCLQRAGLPLDADAVFESTTMGPLLSLLTGREQGGKIILHPGSGSPKKNYHPRFWLEMAEAIQWRFRSGDAKLLILLGPAEKEDAPSFTGPVESFGGNMVISTDTDQLLDLLSQACLFVGHDSGLTHLAAMMGIPTIALFKGSDPVLWRPLGPRVKTILAQKSESILLKEGLKAVTLFLRQNEVPS